MQIQLLYFAHNLKPYFDVEKTHYEVFLKILPSSHSTATWCIMVNVSCGVYLLLSIKSGVLDITIVMIKKVIHFNGKTPSFYNMMYIQIFHKHIYHVFE